MSKKYKVVTEHNEFLGHYQAHNEYEAAQKAYQIHKNIMDKPTRSFVCSKGAKKFFVELSEEQ